MRRITTGLITIATAILLCATPFAAHSAVTSRAVSLTALSSAMRAGRMAQQAETLCGITRVSGYVVDSRNHDIVLVGKVDHSYPSLHLDDLVVALRNVWLSYAQVRGHVRYYSDPGCSIDPNPRVLAQLRDLQDQPLDFSKADEVQARSDQWRQIGRQPQQVRVMGVPFDSRFAKVMVDADYYMKRLVNGSVALNIPGFDSLSTLHTNSSRTQMRSGDSAQIPRSSMNRFWFSPGEVTYEDRGGLIILRSCTVKLLTEEEFLTEQGAVAGKGRPDPLAGQFARSFTKQYDAIGAQCPIYKELQGLFAFVGLARLMKDGRANATAPDAFRYLLSEHKVACTPVSRAVSGLTDVKRIDEVIDTEKGKQHMSLIESTCGGVSMNVRPKKVAPARPAGAPSVQTASAPESAPTGVTRRAQSSPSAPTQSVIAARQTAPSKPANPRRTFSLKHVVLSSRKSANAMSWDVPADLE